jgi:glutamate synthase (NADPH/NADH)
MEAAESGRSRWAAPTKVDGLYDPALEKEACGVGFVVQIDGIRSNKVIIIKSTHSMGRKIN